MSAPAIASISQLFQQTGPIALGLLSIQKSGRAKSFSKFWCMEGVRYSFNVLWYDHVADLDRSYIFNYYPETKEVEMIDAALKRTFLKKILLPDFDFSECHVGNTITVNSRQLKIVGYANDFTRSSLQDTNQKTCAIIKPHALAANPTILAQTLATCTKSNLRCNQIRMIQMTQGSVTEFYAEHVGKTFFPQLQEMIMEGPAVVVELLGPDAVMTWRQIIGATDPAKAEPDTLRKQYGVDVTHNAFHGSASTADAARELEIIFRIPPVANVSSANKTVIIVQPKFKAHLSDIIVALGQFLRDHSDSLAITGLTSCTPTADDVGELLASYKGIIARWSEYCDALSSGQCYAIEVSSELPIDQVDCVAVGREFAGPFEPIVAQHLRPESIRARYGSDLVSNCLFVTDIPEETEIHSDFWFRLAHAN